VFVCVCVCVCVRVCVCVCAYIHALARFAWHVRFHSCLTYAFASTQNVQVRIPEELLDPLTMLLMRDPVKLPCSGD
jgi:hypothetical protein